MGLQDNIGDDHLFSELNYDEQDQADSPEKKEQRKRVRDLVEERMEQRRLKEEFEEEWEHDFDWDDGDSD